MFDKFSHKHSRGYTTTRVDVVVGDATAAAYRYYKRQEYQALYNSSIAVTIRENSTKIPQEPPISEQDIIVIIRPVITILSIARQIILIVASHGYSLMEKTAWTQNCEKTLEQHVLAYTE